MENEAIVANADIVLRAITAQGKDAARARGLLDSCCNIAITPVDPWSWPLARVVGVIRLITIIDAGRGRYDQTLCGCRKPGGRFH